MSWFSRAKKKVAKAINKAAEKVSNTIETAGNKISDAANALGNTVAQNVPIIGPAVGAVVRWCGRASSAICDLAATAVKSAGAALTAVTDLLIGGIGGLITGDWGLVKESVIGFFANALGALLIAAGGFVSLIQTVFGVQSHKTKLTEKEIALLKLVFQDSLATGNIRLVKGRSGSGIYSFTDRPFTMGDIIYMKDTAAADWNETLVHECVHVWQYQHEGARYSADALGAQLLLGTDRSYQWWKESPPWENFNAESQAEVFQDMYEYGELQQSGSWVGDDGRFFAASAVAPNRFLFNVQSEDSAPPAQDYTQLGNDSVAYVRSQPSDRA